MRVNARLDEATQQQLQYLTQTTGRSVSDVVRESVAQYYVQVRRQRGAGRFLALAGKGDSGRSEVASNIKAQLSEVLGHKHHLAPVPAAARPASKPAGRKPRAAR